MIATKEGGIICAAVIAVAVLVGVVGFGTLVVAVGAAAAGLSAVADFL